MATAVSDISSILTQKFGDDWYNQNNREHPLLDQLQIVQQVGGEKLRRSVQLSGSLVANYSEGGTLNTFNTDRREDFQLAWGLYDGGIQVTDLAMDVHVGHAPGDMDLLAEEIKNKVDYYLSKIDADLFAGSVGSPAIQGFLSGAIADTSSYGGISRLDAAQWQSYVTSSLTSNVLTVDMLRTAVRNVRTNCGVQPNLICTSPAVMQKYKALLDPYTNIVQPASIARVNVGAPNASFESIPLIDDVNCTNRSMYLLNTSKIQLVELAASNRPDIVGRIPVQLPGGTLNFYLRRVWSNVAASQFSLQWQGQMFVQSRFQGVIHDINVT